MMQFFSAVAGDIKKPSGMWEFLLEKLRFIPDYAWWIIVFTIFIKLFTSPLDFYQKYKMRKNQRIAELIAPDMEKLEKQYGSDKRVLQQKQFQLQKQNGYSIFSACLPMILSLVIFFTFWSGMRNVTPYNEFKDYVERYDVFAAEYYELTGIAYVEGAPPEEASRQGREDEFDNMILDWARAHTENGALPVSSDEWIGDVNDYNAFAEYQKTGSFENFVLKYRELTTEKGFWDEIFLSTAQIDGKSVTLRERVSAIIDKTSTEQESVVVSAVNAAFAAKLKDKPQTIPFDSFADFEEIKACFDEMGLAYNYIENYWDAIVGIAEDAASQKVYGHYKQKNSGFLWIKSIWIPDVPWKNAVLSHSSFSSNVSGYMSESNKGGLDSAVSAKIRTEETYNKVMGKILEDDDMRHTNGYLLLPILAVGLSILSQLIMGRQQRKGAQAAGAGTLKMMMFIMPLVIGFFALQYTSAFAIFMVTNSFMSLLMNLLIAVILNLIYRDKKQTGDGGVIKYGRKDPNDFIKK